MSFFFYSILFLNLSYFINATLIKRQQSDFNYNHPSQFVKNLANFNIKYEMEYNFYKLPSKGNVKKIPWPSSFWPTFNDSINDPWYTEKPQDRGPTGKYAQAFNMDPDILENVISYNLGLESVRKYTEKCSNDKECQNNFMCGKRKRYDKKTHRYIPDSIGKCVPEWYGLCHAWSFASLVEKEPRCPVEVNGVKFYTSDIEALLLIFYNTRDLQYTYIGNRCSLPSSQFSSSNLDQYGRLKEISCRDINPATFHLILTNYIGRDGKALIMDEDSSAEVWNYPISRFEILRSQYISSQVAGKYFRSTSYPFNSKAKLLYVKTRLYFLRETIPAPYPLTYNAYDYNKQYLNPSYEDVKEYDYILELDNSYNIVGGEWISKSKFSHPDFLWAPLSKFDKSNGVDHILFKHEFIDKKSGKKKVDGIRFSNVKALLEKSLKNNCKLTDWKSW